MQFYGFNGTNSYNLLEKVAYNLVWVITDNYIWYIIPYIS